MIYSVNFSYDCIVNFFNLFVQTFYNVGIILLLFAFNRIIDTFIVKTDKIL